MSEVRQRTARSRWLGQSVREWAPWAVVAVALGGLMTLGSQIGQVKGRLAAPPPELIVAVDLPAREIPVGVRFNADILIDRAFSLTGYTVNLTYPLKLARVERIVVHPALEGSGRGVTTLEPDHDPTAGIIRLASATCPANPCGATPPPLPPPGVSGALRLATITFTALGVGEGELAIVDATAADTGWRNFEVDRIGGAFGVSKAALLLSVFAPPSDRDIDRLVFHTNPFRGGHFQIKIGPYQFFDGSVGASELTILEYPWIDRAPISLAATTGQIPRAFGRRTLVGAVNEIVAQSTDRLASRWRLPWHDPTDGPGWVVVTNPNGEVIRAVVRASFGVVAEGEIDAQSTGVIALGDRFAGPLSVDTFSTAEDQPAQSLVTHRIGDEASGAMVEMMATPASELRADYLFVGFDAKRADDPDHLVFGNPGDQPALVTIHLGVDEFARFTLGPSQAIQLRLLGGVGGPVFVRSRHRHDPRQSVAIVAAQRGGSPGRITRLIPAMPLDRLTSRVEFIWPELSDDTSQTWLVVVNPGERHVGYQVFDDDGVITRGQLGPLGIDVVELNNNDRRRSFNLVGFHPDHPTQPRPIFGAKRLIWNGILANLNGLPTLPPTPPPPTD